MPWLPSRQRLTAKSRPRVALVITLTGLVVIGAIWLDFAERVQRERDDLVLRGQRQARMFSVATEEAMETIDGLRTVAETKLARADTVASGYGSYLGPIPDKGGYGLTGLVAPSDAASTLNLTGLGSFDGDPALRRELEVAMSLDAMFRWVKRVHPETPWVYYLSARRFMCVYPYIPFSDFFMDEAFFDMDLFAKGIPENNPERAPYVTEVYVDEAGKGLMVTFGAPVYEGDAFRGIVGFDLTLDSLSGFLKRYSFVGDRYYVVDDNAELIAMADASGDLQPPVDRRSFNAFRPGLFEQARAQVDGSHTVTFDRAEVTSAQLAGVPWILIAERPEWRIYHAAARGTLPLIALIAVLLSAIVMFSRERHRQQQFEADRTTRRFRHLLDSSSDMIAVVDPDTARYLDVNQAMCALLGLRREEIVTRRVTDFSSALTSMERWGEAVAEMRSLGRFTHEDVARRSDGSAVFLEVNAHYAVDEDGEYIVGILRDVSERKQAETALHKANQRFISVLEGIDASVHVADMDTGEVLYANPKIRERVGDVVGTFCWETIYPNQHGGSEACCNDQLLTADGEPTETCRWESHSGDEGPWYRHAARAIPWDHGRYVRLELAYDITDLKRAEAERERLQRELWQAQKMEAIGQLTGGIAHDFNNILASIMGLSELARERFGASDGRLNDYLEQILHAGGRARGLIRQLLVYSRGDRTATAQPLLVVPQLEEVLNLLRPMLPATIEMRTDWSETSPMITVDPMHLQQLLMNLCINARDAMKRGGVLSVSVRVRSFDGAECRICHEQVKGEWVCIEVADSGTGIPDAMLDRMFQPFFTTKDANEGGGMGLAVVQGVVSTYRGHVLVETVPGDGTRIQILLPVTDQAGQTPSSVSAPYESLDLQGRKLLVVEDEPLVRRYLKELLLSANAEVKACRNADEALTLFRQSPHAYSLIVTDHTMPGMSGTEMLRVMRKLNPEVPVVLFSGYADVVSELEREELNITDVLLKPLMGDELEAAIARALGAR